MPRGLISPFFFVVVGVVGLVLAIYACSYLLHRKAKKEFVYEKPKNIHYVLPEKFDLPETSGFQIRNLS